MNLNNNLLIFAKFKKIKKENEKTFLHRKVKINIKY